MPPKRPFFQKCNLDIQPWRYDPHKLGIVESYLYTEYEHNVTWTVWKLEENVKFAG